MLHFTVLRGIFPLLVCFLLLNDAEPAERMVWVIVFALCFVRAAAAAAAPFLLPFLFCAGARERDRHHDVPVPQHDEGGWDPGNSLYILCTINRAINSKCCCIFF